MWQEIQDRVITNFVLTWYLILGVKAVGTLIVWFGHEMMFDV